MKPSQQPSCTMKWKRGIVTRVLSNKVVEVDGIPRHVSHIIKADVHILQNKEEHKQRQYVEIEFDNDNLYESYPDQAEYNERTDVLSDVPRPIRPIPRT